MFHFLTKHKPKVLGIDISATAVKLIELSFDNGRYSVESYSVMPIPLNAIIEEDIKDIEAVATAINAAVVRSGTHLRAAATAISSSSVITKIIQLDALLEGLTLEAQVEFESARFIPFALEEVALDFEVLGPSESHAEKMDVLVVASREQNVESRSHVLLAAGLAPKIVDVESFAMERACSLIVNQLPDRGQEKIIAVVDIGATMTTIHVLKNMQSIYTREESFGGRQLTEAIQHRYGMSYEQAGIAKKQGGVAEDYEPALLDPFRESLVPLIRRALQFFFASSQYTEVDHIVLAGGGAMIPGLSEILKERLGTENSIANPFSEMTVSKKVDVQRLAADASALMVACGLALRSFL
jgi:type IV pilus assembly protein PilM